MGGIEHGVQLLRDDCGRRGQHQRFGALEPLVAGPLIPGAPVTTRPFRVGRDVLAPGISQDAGIVGHLDLGQDEVARRPFRSLGPKWTKVSSTQVATFKLA